MKKPNAELFDQKLETVKDLINALFQMPKGYLLHPLGQQIQMVIDHYHGCVCPDDPDCPGRIVDGILDEAKDMGEPEEIEVPNEKLLTYQDSNSMELHAVIGYEDICENGNYEAALYGVYSTEELARECGDELVEAGVIHHYEIECPRLDEFGWK